jgi:hypothetical protein
MTRIQEYDYVKPQLHFELKIKGHPDVKVQTDHALSRKNCKEYTADMTAHILRVEREFKAAVPKPRTIYTEARVKRRR